MKKILLTILMCGFCSGLFAGVMIKTNDSVAGAYLGFTHTNDYAFDNVKNEFYFGGGFIPQFSLGVMYEFKSADLKPFHFNLGWKAGLEMVTLGTGPDIGFSYMLTNTEKMRIELDANLEAIVGITIGDVTSSFLQSSCNVLFMPLNRKGFFGGAGISTVGAASFVEYKQYKRVSDVFILPALQFVLGYRFY